jgi:hypothetical protein
MLPSLYGPKIFRASPEKDFFDSIEPKAMLRFVVARRSEFFDGKAYIRDL